MVFKVQHEGAGSDNGRTPSPIIWGDCPLVEGLFDFGSHYMVEDDFVNSMAFAATDADLHQYATYGDTGSTITSLADERGGVLRIALDGTDNDEAWIQCGGNTGAAFLISDTAGSDKKLWFEARIKVSAITNNVNYFVGLAQQARAAADTITDAGAFGDFDHIGFHVLEADGDDMSFVHGKTSGTHQVILADAHVPVADAYVKVGFKYDPGKPASQRIAIFVNGAEKSTYVTATQIATANFPDGEELSPIFGLKDGGLGGAAALEVDWFRCVQLV